MPHWSSARAAVSAQLMIRLAGEHGVSFERCIAGTGLTPQELSDPTREIAGSQELDVLRNILRELDPQVPFGLLAGQRYHLTTLGIWGFALLSSSTLHQAIEVGLRYFDLTFSFNRPSFEFEDGEGRLIYDGSENPKDVRATLIERDLGALLAVQRDLVGRTVVNHGLELEMSEPPYAAIFEPLFGAAPRFNAGRNCLRFDLSALDVKQPLADAFGLRFCEQQCGALIEQRGVRSGVAGRVRGRMLRDPGEFPRMTQIAAELGMTTRTLRNQLYREQTSYRALIDDVRERLAEQLLVSTRMTVDQIADRLGYADTSSFISAFKRWKGAPPSNFRLVNSRST